MGAEAQVLHWVATFLYPAVFGLLVACGLGAPISEELVLLTAGMVVAKGNGHLGLMIATGYVGTLSGDFLLYRIGRKLGPAALRNKRLSKVLTPRRVVWIESHFHRHGFWTLFAVRFLPGLRAATYLVAGVSQFRPRRFVGADAVAALISAPVLTFLGFRFGTVVLRSVQVWGRYLLFAAALALVAYTVHKLRVRARREARHEPELAAHIVEEELEHEHLLPRPPVPPPGAKNEHRTEGEHPFPE